MSAHILVVDDDEIFLFQLEQVLKGSRYEVVTAKDAFEALRLLSLGDFDIVLTDIMLPKMSGFTLLNAIKKVNRQQLIVLMSAFGTIDYAVEATRKGASDFIIKPFSNDYLLVVIERILNQKRVHEENALLREQLSERFSFHNIIGKSAKMQKIYETISAVAATEANILIMGETGTGKDLVAQAIHYQSRRRDRRFVKVDCSMLSDTLLESELFGHERGAFTHAIQQRIGRFEYANGGTIFLDEIAELSPALQVKLLRVLQDRKFERIGSNKTIEVDVRVIAATNRDLNKELSQGKFREDLYHRLNVVQITLPPLRERRDDVCLLARHFLNKSCQKLNKNIRGISQEALNAMMKYDWPGNVRELENTIERAAIMEKGRLISKVDLPGIAESSQKDIPWHGDQIDPSIPFQKLKRGLIDRFEREYLKKLLTECKGNIMKASKFALMDYKTLYEKMKKHGLCRSDFIGRPSN
jgi:DNA-binding NtrC family response regulator